MMNRKRRISLKRINKYFKMISYIYILYRIMNILIVSVIGFVYTPNVQTAPHKDNITPHIDFEYPAPNLDEVITYETLAWCHKCLINENEFSNYSDYRFIEGKIIVSFILLPWTIPIDLLSPDNDANYRHQYNDHYGIDVWGGYNVFSGKYEQIFFYSGNGIILLLIWIIYVIVSLFCDLCKFIHKLICGKPINPAAR